jgi:dTDP-4-dehydrorhamnose 3,5-epimerase
VVCVPPGVYHGVRVLGAGSAVLVNAVDRAYTHEDPDHYRVAADSDAIPYRW